MPRLSPSRVEQEGTRLWDAVENLMAANERTPVQTSEFDFVRKLLTRLRRQRASTPQQTCTADMLPHPQGCNGSHPLGEHMTWLELRVRRWLVDKGPWTNHMQLPHSHTVGLAAIPWHSAQGVRLASEKASDVDSHPEGGFDEYPFESLLRPLVDVLQRPKNVRRLDLNILCTNSHPFILHAFTRVIGIDI